VARFEGLRERKIEAIFGTIKITRAYYICKLCSKGWCPMDRKLGLDKRHWSPSAKRVISYVGSEKPFEKASELLSEVAGMVVSVRAVQEITEDIGLLMYKQNQSQEQRWLFGISDEIADVMGLLKHGFNDRFYVLLDGTTAPTREGWREAKLASFFWADGKDKEGLDKRGATRYVAGFEDSPV
jgi:hypothetical protein